MTMTKHYSIGYEPHQEECFTLPLLNDLSRCSANNWRCRYAIPAGSSGVYCCHPNHSDFRLTANIDSPRQVAAPV